MVDLGMFSGRKREWSLEVDVEKREIVLRGER
jgi:hypothetical protein